MSTSGTLAYDVFIADPIPQNVTEPVPNGDRRMFSPLSVTLVHGERDAVLVDPPLTTAQAEAVGDWVAASGKNLTHIVATHGHGDHWFTAGLLAERFGATVVAAEGTIKEMHRNAAIRPQFWDKLFPGQIPDAPVTAVTVPGNRLTLEGHELHIVEVGHSDTDETSVVHVPDLGLVVAGDVIYNGVHQYLAESADGGRDAWRRAIDVVEDLRPRHIVTGHKNKELDDDALRTIAETRAYLDAADDLLARHDGPLGFFHAMLERFPDRLNPGALWGGAVALARPSATVTATVTATPSAEAEPAPTVTVTETETARVKVKVTKTVTAEPAEDDYSGGGGGGGSAYYENCSAARAAGAAPVRIGDPGYGRHLDRDGDGVGCE